jgi:hypothetical protein
VPDLSQRSQILHALFRQVSTWPHHPEQSAALSHVLQPRHFRHRRPTQGLVGFAGQRGGRGRAEGGAVSFGMVEGGGEGGSFAPCAG